MSSKQSDEVMSSCLSATSGPSVEGMNPSEASRVLSRRRTLLRLLDLETRLVENEIRRLRGAGATTPSSAASVSRETPERRTSPQAPSRRSSASSQIAMERLELTSVSASRCSSPIAGLEVGSREGAISPRPSLTPRPSSALRSHSSRTSRSTSSGERHASRLPRSLVQQLAEREIQEAARQLEALRLRGSAQQREMQMRAQALQTQTQVVLEALQDICNLDKRNKRKPGSISLETLRRWIHEGWLAGTERELQRLRLGLSSSRLRQKRAEFEPSIADLTLIEVQNQRREEQLAALHNHLQQTYFQNGSHLGQKERALRIVEQRDTEVLRLRREVAARRRQAQEQRGLLLALNRRNQQLTRQALSLEQQHQNSDAANANIKVVTEYVCLKQREKVLRKDLTTWERRKNLLNTQLQSARRKKSASVPEPVTVPQCTPTGSEIQGEVSHHENDEQETEAHIASTTSAPSDSTSESSRSRRQSTSSLATSSSRNFR